MKVCKKCGVKSDDFSRDSSKKDGYRNTCKPCLIEYDRARRASDSERNRRLESDHEPLKPDDWDVSVGNDGKRDAKAAKEKRQEFSRSMGVFARNLGRGELDERDGHYIGGLAEQERRFSNRRTARTISLLAAHEALHLRQFKAAAKEFFADKIVPSGYALKVSKTVRRTVVLFLSDLHIGAEMSALDNPVEFRAVQEARRLEYIVRQAVDYKPQYRADSELLLILGGDMIEGLLLHDLRDGAPLTEQMIRFWRYFSAVLSLVAQAFPKVRVVCQPGNHGRNKLRHPGRATSSKWDGVEFQLYYALQMMSTSLKNVTFDIGFRAVSIVDLYGSKLLVTHGDTEIKFGHPDTKASANKAELDKLNTTGLFGATFDAVCVGHFHTPRHQPGHPTILFNGALIPPNGHARAAGYIAEQCGQWLWEAVEGYPVGDVRYLPVGKAQDVDDRLGTIVRPFSL